MQGFDRTASIAQIQADLNLNTTQPVYLLVGSLWDSYTDKANVYPRLQDWYTRRQVCDNLLGGVWNAVDFVAAGVDEKDSQFTDNLTAWRQRAHDEILKLESQAAANVAPIVGEMTQTAPVMPPNAAGPDANDPAYWGSPYYPIRKSF